MSPDLQQERQQAHALLDRLPPAKLGAVRSLLAVMLDEDNDEDNGEDNGELTDADRAAIQAGLASLDRNGGVPMEEVLGDLGLTLAEFEKLAAAPDLITKP